MEPASYYAAVEAAFHKAVEELRSHKLHPSDTRPTEIGTDPLLEAVWCRPDGSVYGRMATEGAFALSFTLIDKRFEVDGRPDFVAFTAGIKNESGLRTTQAAFEEALKPLYNKYTSLFAKIVFAIRRMFR